MFSCRLACALARCPLEELSSILRLFVESACSICLFGSLSCWVSAAALDCFFASADFGFGSVGLALFVLV